MRADARAPTVAFPRVLRGNRKRKKRSVVGNTDAKHEHDLSLSLSLIHTYIHTETHTPHAFVLFLFLSRFLAILTFLGDPNASDALREQIN